MPASFVICHLQTIVNSYWVIEQIPPPEFRIQNLGWDDFGRWWARLLLVWRNMKFDSKDASKVFSKHLSILQASFYGIHFWTKFLLQPLLWLAWKKSSAMAWSQGDGETLKNSLPPRFSWNSPTPNRGTSPASSSSLKLGKETVALSKSNVADDFSGSFSYFITLWKYPIFRTNLSQHDLMYHCRNCKNNSNLVRHNSCIE